MRRNEIERLLPEAFRAALVDSPPLADVLDVMEALHRPDEQVLDGLDAFFDPTRTDDRFVPLLARWVDLERLFVQSATGRVDPGEREPISTGLGRLRELISRAAFLSRWRGTRVGLIAFLETATGAIGFEIDEQVPGEAMRPRPFHIRVLAPSDQEPHRALLERIVELEKPAYVTYELAFASPGTTP
jgi:phage tail-like protein